MSDDDDKETALLPVSPSTGLDPEIRQFVGRVMTGYESAHRTIADLCEVMSKRAQSAEVAAERFMKLQIDVMNEREELISKKHKRDLELIETHQRQEVMSAFLGDARVALTLAAKKWIGIPITGNDSHGLQDLLKTLSSDQIETLMSEGELKLSDTQRQLLMATLTSLAESEAKKNAPETPALAEATPEAAE